MVDLFRKLNTLVRAQIEGLLDEAPRLPGTRQRRGTGPLNPDDPKIRRDVQLLREQIDEALDREEALLGQLETLRQQATDHSLAADNALLAGADDAARRALAAQRYSDQQIAMLEADLAHHRQMTAALMDQVNVLESQLAAAQAARTEAPAPEPEPSVQAQPAPERTIKVPIVVDIGDVPPVADADSRPTTPEDLPAAPPRSADNLEARRARLARPDSQEKEE